MSGWLTLRHRLSGARESLQAALAMPMQQQLAQLQAILATNQDTAFGQRYGFGSIQTYEEYVARVPIQDYESLRSELEAMANLGSEQLCHEVVFFETTGGSVTGPKLIPYTQASLQALQRGLLPWLHDLLQHRPGIVQGRSYWSISPVTARAQVLPSGIPLGIGNDALYFGESLAAALMAELAVPVEVAAVSELDSWRYATLVYLCAAEDLSFISVWSPTFLLELLEALREWAPVIVQAIRSGSVAGAGSPVELNRLPAIPPDPQRAERVRHALGGTKPDTALLWPHLQTISCWADAQAARYIPALRDLFPQAHLQGKGLLSTEAMVTLPWSAACAPVLAVQSGFYEFVDAQERVWRCHELTQGTVYRVLLTTHAGLYRYDSGDLVRVEGWCEQTPCLRFVGRAGLVSDLCGEKLSEAFITQGLADIPGFALLAPDVRQRPGYILYLDAAVLDAQQAQSRAQDLEHKLLHNPQYRYARDLRQLAAVQAVRVRQPWSRYVAFQLAQGRCLGDIKPVSLSTDTQWHRRFEVAS